MSSRFFAYTLAAIVLATPAIATATEPRCEFPTCFPMGDAQLVRVFAAAGMRLEVVTVGEISNVTMVLFRMITLDQKNPRWREGYLVANNANTGFAFRPLVPRKSPDPSLEIVGDFAKAGTVVVGGLGVATSTTLKLDARASKTLRGVAAVKAYRQQSAMDRFAQNVDEAQTLLDAELSKLPKACAANITGLVDGSTLSPNQITQLDESLSASGMEHRCLDSVAAIEALCQRQADAPAKLATAVKTLRCTFVPSGNSSASLDRKTQTLNVKVSLTQARDGRSSFNWLRFLETSLK